MQIITSATWFSTSGLAAEAAISSNFTICGFKTELLSANTKWASNCQHTCYIHMVTADIYLHNSGYSIFCVRHTLRMSIPNQSTVLLCVRVAWAGSIILAQSEHSIAQCASGLSRLILAPKEHTIPIPVHISSNPHLLFYMDQYFNTDIPGESTNCLTWGCRHPRKYSG